MFTRYQEYRKRLEEAREEAIAETIKAYQAWEAWHNNGAKEDEMPSIPEPILNAIRRNTQDKNTPSPDS